MRIRAGGALWPVVLAAALALPAQALAQQNLAANQSGLFQGGGQRPNNLELMAGLIYSDNVQLTSADQAGGTIETLGMDVNYSRRGSRLDVDARGAINWQDYPGNTFGSGVLGNLDALAGLVLLPQTLNWVVEETFGQVLANPLDAATPDNLQNVYYFTTGPDLTLHLDDANSLRLGARYSRTDSGLDGLSGNRYQGDFGFTHALGALSSVSLNVDADRYSFVDAIPGENYDQGEVYGRYEINAARTSFSVDLGYTTIRPSGGSATGGELARVSLSRRLSPSMSAHIFGHVEFSDSADQLRGLAAQADPTHPGSYVLAASDPFKSYDGGLSWSFERSRTGISAQVERTREVHETFSEYDRNVTTWSVNALRRLRPQLTLSAAVSRSDESYFVSGFNDQLLQASVILEWAVGRSLSLRLRYDRTDRSAAIASSEYTENRLGLYATWSALGRH